jgi:large subunit ribosomal protein L18
MKEANKRFDYRVKRVRAKIYGTENRPRLCVYIGHKHIYAQIIDDSKGITLISASTLSPELKGKLNITDTVVAAKFVGDLIAKKATIKNVKKVVFDRRGNRYAGRIKAFADTTRKNGLEF